MTKFILKYNLNILIDKYSQYKRNFCLGFRLTLFNKALKNRI